MNTSKQQVREERYEKCSQCGKRDETVATRICGYHDDVNNIEVYETICDDCEDEHLMDI